MTKTKMVDFIVNYKSKNCLIIFYLIALGLSYTFLVAPGQSYTSIYFNDTMALLDAAYRVSLGQIPSKDFYSAIGPLNFYLSSVGLTLGFNSGVTFALGGILACILILTPGLLMMYTRFSTVSVLLVSVYFWLLIVVPIDTGDSFNNLTWGLFYNRQSWAALCFVFLFYVEPRKKTNRVMWLDGSLLAILVLFVLYTKITYGLIALAFVFANMIFSQYNRSVSLISLVIIVLSIVLVELTLDLNEDYVKNIIRAINDRDLNRGGFWGMISTVVKHANSLIAMILVMFYLVFFGKNRILDGLFVLGCIATGVVITDQNGGPENFIPVVFTVLIVCAELIRRYNINPVNVISMDISQRYLAVLMLVIIFLAGPLANRIVALQDYYSKSVNMQAMEGAPEQLSSFLVSTKHRHFLLGKYLEQKNSPLDLIGDLRLSLDDSLSTYEYYLSIIDGHNLLKPYINIESKIFVLDLSNPFMFTHGLRPRINGYPFKYTLPLDEVEVIFKGITIVMEPKLTYENHRYSWFKKAYGDYVEKNYVKLASSKYWNLWSEVEEKTRNQMDI